MDLIIVRHGEPDVSGDLTDPPLTELGHRQAKATASFLANITFDSVYVSPQRRARQTAEPLANHHSMTPVVDERIAEFDYELGSYIHPDSFQGMTRAEATAQLLEYQGPPFSTRVLAGFSDIIDNNRGRTVAVVCHGGVINAMIRDILQTDQPVGPNHASVTRVAASSSGVRSLITFNEHSWLIGL